MPAKGASRLKARTRTTWSEGRIQILLDRLAKQFPDAHCELNYGNAYELLMATILSAQCTDKRVNQVTPLLFKKYPNVKDMAAARLDDIEKIIKSTGFFRQKAKSLQGASQTIVEKFNGEVPKRMSDLLQLRGVARKTANVVLGNIWNTPDGVVVDTHVRRISNRLGLTKQKDPKKIEVDLNTQIPKERWARFSHELIFLGRQICAARKPQCELCPLKTICPKHGVVA